MNERLDTLRRFQKCLRRAVEASTPGEAEAAEAAARRIMQACDINPLKLTDKSLYDHTTFADNALLIRLRKEYIVAQRKRKKKNVRGVSGQIANSDLEKFRLLLNKGFGLTEIAARIGIETSTLNSARAYRMHRSRQWIRDSRGLIQWARGQEPLLTKPQPTAENSERKAPTSSP